MRIHLLLSAALLGVLPLCCEAPDRDAREEDLLRVFVSIVPEAYVVERIGGEHLSVGVLVQPGQSPHTFEMTPRQVTALSRSRLFFAIGMPFERALIEKVRSEMPHLTVVRTDAGIERRPLVLDSGEPEGESSERGDAGGAELDPHIWMSPFLLGTMAKNIADALVEADPAHAQDYLSNLEAFLVDVDSTDARIREVLRPYRGRSFYVFHPAFGYFGDTYGLRQVGLEIEGKSPTPRQLDAVIESARDEDIRIIFVQPQFDRKAARSVADALDAAVVPIDPLAKDVLRNLREMAQKLDEALDG
jgi:zinc transport system substrate-binding protein